MSTTKRFLTVALAAAFLIAAPAGALTINPAPTGEESLLEIWEHLYGNSTYADSQDLWDDRGIDFQGGNDLFLLLNGPEAVVEAIHAGNDQQLGFYELDGAGDPINETSITPVVEGSSGTGSIALDPFNPLTEPFGFFIDSGSYDFGADDWSSPPTRLFSQADQNAGFRHLAVLDTSGLGPASTGNTFDLLLAWEDGDELGDQDYNDLVVGVSSVRHVIPEPASMTLLGLGLAGFATRRFVSRKKKA